MIKIESTNRNWSEISLEKARRAFDLTTKRTDLGFLRLPLEDVHWQSSAARAKEIVQSADQIVCAGIGGSSLGPQVFHALSESSRVLFLDNVDPLSLDRLFRQISDLRRVHWVWTSKSGSTLETLAQLETVAQLLSEQGLDLGTCSTVISDPGSNPLTQWARENSVPCLAIPPDVGGRYSVLSPVGLLPAALMGLDLSAIREGALWALKQRELVANLAALALDSWEREEWTTLFWTYSDRLRVFGSWIQQLWAESLGKKVDRKGRPAPRASFPVPCVGAVDQHSILQQVMEGARDKWVWVTRVSESEAAGRPLNNRVTKGSGWITGQTMGQIFSAECQGMAYGLDQVGVSQVIVRWDGASERSLGAGFVLMELVVASLGEVLEINAFDQPGVQLGKENAERILRK